MTSAIGRLVVDVLTNHRGSAVAYGDVVVLDSTQDDSFTVDTSGAYTGMVGVCIEPNGIANGATGRIQFGGKCAQINLSASVTRGHYIKTHTVAAQGADAGTSRVVGAFGKTTKTSATPPILLFGFPDAASSSAAAGTPALTLSTTNSAGAAATFVATDATVAVFDATAPTTQAFGDAAAAGSAGTAARRDHKHAMPAAFGAASYTRSSGDYSMTSSTFADVDATNLNFTITTGARRVLIMLTATIIISSNTDEAMFDILLDGSRIGGDNGIWLIQAAAAGLSEPVSLFWPTDALSAGSHTFKLQWRVSFNTHTITLKGNTTGANETPLRFAVVELPV